MICLQQRQTHVSNKLRWRGDHMLHSKIDVLRACFLSSRGGVQHREVQRKVCYVQSTSSKGFEHDIPHGNRKKGSEERLFLETELVLRAEQGESPCQHTLFWSGVRNIPVASSDHICEKDGYKNQWINQYCMKNSQLWKVMSSWESRETEHQQPCSWATPRQRSWNIIFTEGALLPGKSIKQEFLVYFCRMTTILRYPLS